MINLDAPQCFSGECYVDDIPDYKGPEGPTEKGACSIFFSLCACCVVVCMYACTWLYVYLICRVMLMLYALSLLLSLFLLYLSHFLLPVNLGERVLAALFVNWVNARNAAMAAAAATASPPSSPDPGPSDPERSSQKKEKREKKEKEKKEREKKEEEAKNSVKGPMFALPPETPILISDESSGSVLLRTTVAGLTGANALSLSLCVCALTTLHR